MEGTLKDAAVVLGLGIVGVEQAEVLRDKEIIEEQLKRAGRYETLLNMRMKNEIPKEEPQAAGSWGADCGTGAADGSVR